MKKLCEMNKRDLMGWAEGTLDVQKAAVVSGHLEGCDSCRREAEGLHRLNGLLRSAKENLAVPQGFETAFWAKVSERQSRPRLAGLLHNWGAMIPMPNLRQAVAFMTLAFLVGNAGGIAWELRREAPAETPPASVRHFSSLQEFKGVPSHSLAGAYLKNIKNEEFE